MLKMEGTCAIVEHAFGNLTVVEVISLYTASFLLWLSLYTGHCRVSEEKKNLIIQEKKSESHREMNFSHCTVRKLAHDNI